jgi:hypothetical protein
MAPKTKATEHPASLRGTPESVESLGALGMLYRMATGYGILACADGTLIHVTLQAPGDGPVWKLASASVEWTDGPLTGLMLEGFTVRQRETKAGGNVGYRLDTMMPSRTWQKGAMTRYYTILHDATAYLTGPADEGKAGKGESSTVSLGLEGKTPSTQRPESEALANLDKVLKTAFFALLGSDKSAVRKLIEARKVAPAETATKAKAEADDGIGAL